MACFYFSLFPIVWSTQEESCGCCVCKDRCNPHLSSALVLPAVAKTQIDVSRVLSAILDPSLCVQRRYTGAHHHHHPPTLENRLSYAPRLTIYSRGEKKFSSAGGDGVAHLLL